MSLEGEQIQDYISTSQNYKTGFEAGAVYADLAFTILLEDNTCPTVDSNQTIANNGVVETPKSNWVKKISGPEKAKSDTIVEYQVEEYKLSNDETTDVDRQSVRWCMWIDGENILIPRDKSEIEEQKKPVNLEIEEERDNLILFTSYDYATSTLKIKFSKWLDTKQVRVEAYMKKAGGKGDPTQLTIIEAIPEIISAYWVNEFDEEINVAGYQQDIFIRIVSVGLRGKNIKLDVFELSEFIGLLDKSLKFEDNSLAINNFICKKQFVYKEEGNNEDIAHSYKPYYQNKQLYFKATPDEEIINQKDAYGMYLKLTTEEEIYDAYFAVSETEPANIQTEKPHTYYKKLYEAFLSQSVSIIVKSANLEGKIVDVKIKENEPVLVGVNAPLPVVFKGAEQETLTMTFDNAGRAIIDIELRKQSEEEQERWEETLHPVRYNQYCVNDGSVIDLYEDDELYTSNKTNYTFMHKKGKRDKFDLLWLDVKCKGLVIEHHLSFLLDAFLKLKFMSVKESRVRAYMRMLRVGEGTVGESGYTTLFGGQHFTKAPYCRNFDDHPRIQRPFGNTTSSAAGAYQVMGYTWDDTKTKREKYGINDFTPYNQDRLCVVLFKDQRKGMLDLIMKGSIQSATEKYGSYEWASLPPGRYGQPVKTMPQVLSLFDEYFEEEMLGKSDLHLEQGFLRDFEGQQAVPIDASCEPAVIENPDMPDGGSFDNN